MTGWSGAISDGRKEVSEEGPFQARSGLSKNPSGLRSGVRVHEGGHSPHKWPGSRSGWFYTRVIEEETEARKGKSVPGSRQ